MHREGLVKSLEEYTKQYPEERDTAEKIIRFIKNHADCFSRSQTAGHITGSAWIVNNQNRVLLTFHRKLEIWIQPGGHADGCSDVNEVALKEAVEETGIEPDFVYPGIFDVDVHLIPEHRNEEAHCHYDIRFLMSAGDMESFTMSEESLNMAWVDQHLLERYTTEPSMLRMRDKYLNYLKKK